MGGASGGSELRRSALRRLVGRPTRPSRSPLTPRLANAAAIGGPSSLTIDAATKSLSNTPSHSTYTTQQRQPLLPLTNGGLGADTQRAAAIPLLLLLLLLLRVHHAAHATHFSLQSLRQSGMQGEQMNTEESQFSQQEQLSCVNNAASAHDPHHGGCHGGLGAACRTAGAAWWCPGRGRPARPAAEGSTGGSGGETWSPTVIAKTYRPPLHTNTHTCAPIKRAASIASKNSPPGVAPITAPITT